MSLEPKAVRSRVGLPILGSDRAVERPSGAEPGAYYDIPFLKQPTWDWRIAAYFFLEGVSAGSFLLASLAERAGGGRYAAVRRAGYYVSFAAFVPCAPLLISDLGRPERFHHMLRIFKRTSPMSHGSWSLLAYSIPMSVMVAEQVLGDLPSLPAPLGLIRWMIPARLIGPGGMPMALMLATYPGVLLSTTANPLWSRSRWLGALFAAGAVHAGASAVALALRDAHSDERARVERIERVAAAAETMALAAFLATTGRHARPLVSGRIRRLFLFGAIGGGIVLPVLLKALGPKRGRLGTLARIAASALALCGSFALKLAITYGGHEAARDAGGAHAAATGKH